MEMIRLTNSTLAPRRIGRNRKGHYRGSSDQSYEHARNYKT